MVHLYKLKWPNLVPSTIEMVHLLINTTTFILVYLLQYMKYVFALYLGLLNRINYKYIFKG